MKEIYFISLYKAQTESSENTAYVWNPLRVYYRAK